ncbi:MAG: T9SS type A sorting domain-containing protein [Ignavibacteria bacterium]
MKKLYTLISVLLFSMIAFSNSSAQQQAYVLGVRNFQYGDTLGGTHNMLFFEIYMYHSNPAVSGPFYYGSGQYGFTFNPAIANGGTLSYRIINSDLPLENRPPTSQVLGDQLKLSGPPPWPPGFLMDTVFPGIKIVRVRLRTTALTFANVPLNLTWNGREAAEPAYATIVAAINGIFAVDISANGVSYIDSTNDQHYLPLISPQPFSVNNFSKIKFIWNKSNFAVNYSLQVWDDSTLNHLLVNDSLITDTFKTVSGFTLASKYYWRVKARDSLNNFASSLFWMFETSPFLISPKNDSDNTPATLDFKWHRLPGDFHRYALKISYDSAQNSVAFLDSSITDTFKTVSGLLKNKKHYWSLSGVDSLGNTETSPVWSFKTLLPEISQISPPNNSQNLKPDIKFSWNKVFDYTSYYTLKISTDSLQNNIVLVDSSITDTFKTYRDLDFDKKYYWSVTAKDSFDVYYKSSVWNFRLMPLLVSPSNNSTDLPLSLYMTWRKVFNSEQYTLKVAKDSLLTDILFTDSTLSDTSKLISGLAFSKRYYWKVSLRDSMNNLYSSAVWNFQTMPPQISQISPPNNSQNLKPDIKFSWNKVFDYNSKYILKITSDSLQNNIALVDSSITDTFKTYRDLDFDKKYYWSVTAKDSFDVYYKSSVWNFRLMPLLVSPSNNSTDLPLSLYMTWRKVFNSEQYTLKVAKDSLLTDILFTDSTLSDTSKLISGLAFSKRYYWKVSLRDSMNNLYSSAVWNFQTMPPLISPANNSSDIYISTKFVWHKFISTGTPYTLKISTDPAQSSVVFLDSAITDTSKAVTGLNFDTHYYWSVSAKDSINNLRISGIWNFNSATYLISPANGDNVTENINFKWHKLSNAAGYRIELSTNPGFTTIYYSNPALTDTVLTLPSSEFLTFWRISARNASGYFFTSPVWIFTWEMPLPVELTGFIYSVNMNNAKLSWTTSTELNNSGFDLERQYLSGSVSEEWNKIGFITGHGNSSSQQNYSYEDKNLSSGKYKYRLKQMNFNGSFKYYDLTDEVMIGIPEKSGLSQNYPNPFNPNTVISFNLATNSFVSLKVFDNAGREVKSLVNEFKEAGYYSLNFNGSDLSSGIYFYSIEAENFKQVKKMVLVK